MNTALASPIVARRAAPTLQCKCACGKASSSPGKRCDECARPQRLRTGPATEPDAFSPPDLGHGLPLDRTTRRFFETRFGHDFGAVRVHADDRAAAAARSLHAEAYASGHDLVFGRGRYDPASAAGQRLLAHELTHVVQQRSGLATTAPGAGQHDPAEQEAEANAARLHGAAPMLLRQRAPRLARRRTPEDSTTVTVEAPTGPPGCTLDQHQAIEPAVHGAQDRLQRSIILLDAYIAAPADAAQQAVATALTRHFRRADAAIAGTVRQRLADLRRDMVERDPFPVECHDATDGSCTNSGAYVRNDSELVFCPAFFTGGLDWRIEALTHEMAHALTGLDISDRAYRNDRLLPHLSTAEALDNAESYTMFVSELASGRAVEGAPPADEVEDCAARTEPLVREAIARAQRWNRDAEVIALDQREAMQTDNAGFFTTHLGDATPATRTAAARVFSRMVLRLNDSLEVRCDESAGDACGTTRHAYKGSASNAGRYALTGMGIGAGVGAAGGLGGAVGMLVTGGAAAVLPALGVLALGALAGMALGAIIGAIVGAVHHRPVIRLCPSWSELPGLEDRTEALLAAAYETHGGLDAAQAARHAAFARAVEAHWWPAPPPV
jgi:hypothetical protein